MPIISKELIRGLRVSRGRFYCNVCMEIGEGEDWTLGADPDDLICEYDLYFGDKIYICDNCRRVFSKRGEKRYKPPLF